MQVNPSLLQPEERVLSTLEKDGSRRWLYPRLATGRFWRARRIVAYALIAIFASLPYIRINGRPAVLIDLNHRQFTLFGSSFLPTDMSLLALFMLMTLLSVFLVTALLGRVWCGWGCPQTVYMEYVFRPLERLFGGKTGAGGKPARVPAWRTAILYLIEIAVCLFLAHVFLAYFVGIDQLRIWITRPPSEHPGAFLVMAAVTALMVFDFIYFREQTCIIACPYGRLQSVLLDKDSLIIGYDRTRGEPRGKEKKVASCQLPVAGEIPTGNQQLATSNSPVGDCIDCGLCAAVCPTGIDIRNGMQVECIGCAQCIDACDAVMTKISRPLGLVRYDSQAGMAGEKSRLIRPRVLIYCTIVLAIMGLLSFRLATRAPADVMVLRNVGLPFILTGTDVENKLKIKITNRTDQPHEYRITVVDQPTIRVLSSQSAITLAPGESWTEPVRIDAPATLFVNGKLDILLRVSSAGDVKIDRDCRLLGPSGPLARSQP